MATTLQLTALHARYSLLETVRVPIALIGSLVFPALSLLFFVVPQRAVAENPEWATQAVISLSVFAVLANALFAFGLSIAQSRELPWDPYLRTLPAPAIARVLGHVFSAGSIGVAAIVPVVVLGAVLTAAEASWWRLLLGFVAIAASALPFVFIGIAVGYSMPSKAAIAGLAVAAQLITACSCYGRPVTCPVTVTHRGMPVDACTVTADCATPLADGGDPVADSTDDLCFGRASTRDAGTDGGP
jgi:hypothetical protein